MTVAPYDFNGDTATIDIPIDFLVSLAAILPNEANRLEALAQGPVATAAWILTIDKAMSGADATDEAKARWRSVAYSINEFVMRLEATLVRHIEQNE